MKDASQPERVRITFGLGCMPTFSCAKSESRRKEPLIPEELMTGNLRVRHSFVFVVRITPRITSFLLTRMVSILNVFSNCWTVLFSEQGDDMIDRVALADKSPGADKSRPRRLIGAGDLVIDAGDRRINAAKGLRRTNLAGAIHDTLVVLSF